MTFTERIISNCLQLASLLEDHLSQSLAAVERSIRNFLNALRNGDPFHPSSAEAPRPDPLQLAPRRELHLAQMSAVVKGVFPYFSHTGRNLHVLNSTAQKPVCPDSLDSVWDDNIFHLPQVPKNHVSRERHGEENNLGRVW